MQEFDYRNSLRDLLATKQSANPQYSGRAFARDLGISTTALHGVLNQTRHLAKNNLVVIAEQIGWILTPPILDQNFNTQASWQVSIGQLSEK